MVDSWVAVIYDNSWWPGVVESLQDAVATINFMKPQSGKNRFSWSLKEEKDQIPINEILCILDDAPVPISRRFYSFQDDTYESINALMANILR